MVSGCSRSTATPCSAWNGTWARWSCFYLLAPFLYRLITTPGRALLFFLLAVLQANLLPALLPNPLPETDAYVWQAYIGNLSFVPQLPS